MKKMSLRIATALLAFLFVLPLPARASAHSQGSIVQDVVSDLSSQSYYLMDADTGVVLSEHRSDLRLPMASTTKIMTCLLALEKGDLTASYRIPREAVGIEGSSVYLVEGESLTLEELLYALMLESANDAAVAIALCVGGSVEAFTEMMNDRAAEIGMVNTHFCNPNGLPEEEHYSSARDLSLLMCVAMRNPVFATISSCETKMISSFDGKKRYLSNHNRLLRTYEHCIAGKTGFTKTAGRCLVTAAEQNGKMLICTTLGAPNDWNDHEALYEYGFSLYSSRELASCGSLQFFIPAVGSDAKEITVSNSDPVLLSLREEESVSLHTEYPRFVYAPVAEGDYIGDAVYTLNGVELARVGLFADTPAAEKEQKPSFWQKIWNTIQSWFE